MKIHFIIYILFLFITIGCDNNQKPFFTNRSANQLYQNAGKMAAIMQYDSSLVLLEQAYSQGFQYPMKIVTDPQFYLLIDHPDYRPEVRSLLGQYASESRAHMVRDTMKGIPISVDGLIIDESTGSPLPGVNIELVHTDRQGKYAPDNSTWNPKQFAYLMTDENGTFSIRTIRPGKYQDDNGNEVPSHIHFTLKKEGYRLYASEFTFEDDATLQAIGNPDNVPVARLVSRTGQYPVTIAMQAE